MSEVRIPLAAINVRAVKPSYAYGPLTPFPVEQSQSWGLLRSALPAFEDGKVEIASAFVELVQAVGDETGSVTATLVKLAGRFTAKTTWSQAGGLGTTGATNPVTKASPKFGTLWRWDVTDDVQAWVDGAAENQGWRLTSNVAGNGIAFHGQTTPSAANAPRLVLTYHVIGDAPDALRPAGQVVSSGSPDLTWNGHPEMLGFQVQADPASNGTTPDYDSGTIMDTNARLVTADAVGWVALTDGGSTAWRVRQLTAAGWSKWSPWASLTRTSLGTVAITAPGATVEDPSPPIEWTFSGVQTAWRVRVLSASGAALVDSGLVGGTATSWTSPRLALRDGESAEVEVSVRDDVDSRVAVGGSRVFAADTSTFTFDYDPTVDPMDSLTAQSDGWCPVVRLLGQRVAGIPDEVIIYRRYGDGPETKLARLPGASVFAGSLFSWSDRTARMGHRVRYRVRPVVNGQVAEAGPTATLAPARCRGIWLMSEAADGPMVPIWGNDDGDFSREDLAVVHTPITSGVPVRRRLARVPMSGTVSGDLLDVSGADDYNADDSQDQLEAWAAADAGDTYRLVLGDQNYQVILGNVQVIPTPISGDDRFLAVSFDWWHTGAA